jgi:hypothetical protein
VREGAGGHGRGVQRALTALPLPAFPPPGQCCPRPPALGV